MPADGVTQLDHLCQHHGIKAAARQRRLGGNVVGMGVFRLKAGHFALAMVAQRGAPAQLAGMVMPGHGRQHRGHVAPDQTVPKVIRPQPPHRRGQRRRDPRLIR